MLTETNKLVKVSTYARKINKSPAWVYKLVEKKELQSVKIDGVLFIIDEGSVELIDYEARWQDLMKKTYE